MKFGTVDFVGENPQPTFGNNRITVCFSPFGVPPITCFIEPPFRRHAEPMSTSDISKRVSPRELHNFGS